MSETPIFPARLLDRVREGMNVVDDSGRQLGTVARIRMGDPQAVTTQGEQASPSEAGALAAPAASPGGSTAFGAAIPFVAQGPDGLDLPDQLRRELLRAGFIEVDGRELEGAERYVPGDRIIDVSGDTVRLRRAPRPMRAGSRFQRLRTATVEPVLRTYLGAPHEPSGPVPRPLLIGLGAAAGLAAVAGAASLVYRRRQAQRRPLNKMRRYAAGATELVEHPSARGGALGAALLLGVVLLRSRDRSHPAETAPSRRSVTVTVCLPRLRWT